MTQKMCDKAVNFYYSAIEFVHECYKTHEACDEVVNACFLPLFIFLIDIKPKKCVTVLSLMLISWYPKRW